MIVLLQALIALPKIGAIVEQIVAEVTAWYIAQQRAETYQQIINAAAMSARAKNHDDRLKALEAWRVALSRPRVR